MSEIVNVIKKKTQECVEKSGKELLERIVQRGINEEIERRVQVMTKALSEITTQEKEFAKLTFDNIFYGEDGKEVKAYTKARRDQRDKITNRIKEVGQAIEAAVAEKSDFTKLDRLFPAKPEKPEAQVKTES
jgi:hypothetical protein